MNDSRPPEYHYWNQLMEYLNNDKSVFFDGRLIYPRQLEIHLPANHKRPCNLACGHCAGKLFNKALGRWEMNVLKILEDLKGAIPYHIYGGAYTEPLLNPYYLAFLAKTKEHENYFGMHTNGVLLKELEVNYGWLTELNAISTDKTDYLSIAIDAGTKESWAKTKNSNNPDSFLDILEATRMACNIRDKRGAGHAIRWCYLISSHSGTEYDFGKILGYAKDFGIDSLRFSIPFSNYNQTFDKVREYKRDVEIPLGKEYEEMLAPYLSKNMNEKPYIFWSQPEFTDIDRFTFDKCIYGYYQITFGADGYMYKCSTTATPTAKHCRLGKIPCSIKEFNKIVMSNQDISWNCKEKCFDKGLRCNRMGLECNTSYKEIVCAV